MNCLTLTTPVSACLLMASALAQSVTLGDIKVLSAIHTPLEAEIGVQSMTASGLAIHIAPSEIITSDGLRRVYDDLQHQITHNGYDGPSVSIGSERPVSETHLSFFISAASATGATETREYVVILNDSNPSGTVVDRGLLVVVPTQARSTSAALSPIDLPIVTSPNRYAVSEAHKEGVSVSIPPNLLTAAEKARAAALSRQAAPAGVPVAIPPATSQDQKDAIGDQQNAESSAAQSATATVAASGNSQVRFNGEEPPQNGLAITLPNR